MTKARKRSPSKRRRSKSTRSSPSRPKAKRRTSSRKATRASGTSQSFQLSPERKRDLVGVVLIGLGVLTVLSALSPGQSPASVVWLNLLRYLTGWGAFAVPLALVGTGLWLVLRNFGERLPSMEAERILGVVLLYLALLTVLHALAGAQSFDGGLLLARQGVGGGILGAALWAVLVGALGKAGSVVALLAWTLIGLTFTAGLSLPELFALVLRGLQGSLMRAGEGLPPFTSRRRAQRRPSSPTLAPHPGERTTVDTRSTTQQTTAIPKPPGVSQPQSNSRSGVAIETAAATDTAPRATPTTDWTLPDLTGMLELGAERKADDEFDRQRARLIEETLAVFGAPAHVVEISRGPTITQFGVEPDFIETRGGRRTKVKVSKIAALADDLALALAASSIRIQAPVPGKGFVGIEVPNEETALVALRDVMESEGFQNIDSRLRLGLGQDVSGRPVSADLAVMPHLLIAGTTGSGKSVCVNAIVTCLLLQNTPDELKLVMIDPKRVELTNYNGIPHLLAPVVVELERVVPALKWISREMDDRYQRFAKAGARNIDDYNQHMQLTGQKPLPYLAVVIDELADLMMLAPDETERAITRLAQLARATGIHLVIATQRPSVDVVTGLIKANFPARIAFAVASSVDSRVILDQPGAERLLGRGDMLFQAPDAAAPIRMQGTFVSEEELRRLIRYWRNAALGGEATHPSPAMPIETIPSGVPLRQAPLWEEDQPPDEPEDELFDDAVEVVRQMRRASISLLQRRLRIGYTRAARLIDELETRGIVSTAQSGSQAREVLDYGELTPTEED